MLFKYTGPEETVTKFGVSFAGGKPSEVTDPESIRRLLLNVEFEEVLELEPVTEKAPVRRGRPPKKSAAQ